MNVRTVNQQMIFGHVGVVIGIKWYTKLPVAHGMIKNEFGYDSVRTPKAEIDKRYENKHKDERRAAHAVWGTSMNRDDFEKLNKFLKDNHITKVQLIYTGWEALKQQYKKT